jgi:hypothetical protein
MYKSCWLKLCFGSVLCVSLKFVDHGDRQGNTVQALDRWQHPVASSEALDVLHWAMCPTLYCHICTAIKNASYSPTFFVIADSLLPTMIAKLYNSNS